jgi:hypothetical protein
VTSPANSSGPVHLEAADSSKISVASVLGAMLRHPIQNIVLRWNWKAAILSAIFRAPIFFAASARYGLKLAVAGAAVEAAFNSVGAGLYGAFLQNIRNARPAWLAWVLGAWTVPAIIQVTENCFHRAAGTSTLHLGIIISIILSALSAMFNLFAMRRGSLLAGNEARPLLRDLGNMPRLLLDFLLTVPRWISSFFCAPVNDKLLPDNIKRWGEKSA